VKVSVTGVPVTTVGVRLDPVSLLLEQADIIRTTTSRGSHVFMTPFQTTAGVQARRA
jgi:hypothetical protein